MQAPVLVDVEGRARRPWITWFTDCSTNAVTGVAVTPGDLSRESVLAGLRSAVLREEPYGPFGGVPESSSAWRAMTKSSSAMRSMLASRRAVRRFLSAPFSFCFCCQMTPPKEATAPTRVAKKAMRAVARSDSTPTF